MSQRFSYVKYDNQAAELQAKFKWVFEDVEMLVDTLDEGRAKALVLTKLEEAYMWVGKSIRDSQIERNPDTEEQPERNNE